VKQAPELSLTDIEEEEKQVMDDPWFNATLLASPHLQPQSYLTRSSSIEEAEVDAMAQIEEQELQELLALAEDDGDQMQHIPSSPTRYGSDEEDYDDIFMEIVSSQDARGSKEEDSMDLSNG
jgi:hypothetical protein